MTYIRKTKDEFQLWANYGQGWEYETAEESRKEIKERLKEYRENAGQYQYKTKKVRVKILPFEEILTLKQVKKMPVISQGQFDNIIFENENYRVTLSRMTIQDGMEYDNEITVLRLVQGLWKEVNKYEAK